MLKSQEGIHSVTVALLAERGVVHYDPYAWTADKIIGVSVPLHTPSFDTLPFAATFSGPGVLFRRPLIIPPTSA